MNRRTNQENPVKTQTELYFDQLFQANEEYADLQWQLKKASMRAYGLASPSCVTNTRVQVSVGLEAAFIRKLDKRDQLELRLSARLRLLHALISQASGLVDQYTSGREKTILTLRYLKGYEWLQVSKEVDDLSPKQLRRIARKGLCKIVLPEDAIWIDRHGLVA